jgi:hypothetical protein
MRETCAQPARRICFQGLMRVILITALILAHATREFRGFFPFPLS